MKHFYRPRQSDNQVPNLESESRSKELDSIGDAYQVDRNEEIIPSENRFLKSSLKMKKPTVIKFKKKTPIQNQFESKGNNEQGVSTVKPDFKKWLTESKEKLISSITAKIEENSKEPETTPEFYRLGKMLGKGAFGKVNLGMHKITDTLVAIKSINKEFLEEERSRRKVAKEVAILKKINHPNICMLYETFESLKHFLIVIELCSGGDLLNYVRKRRKLTEDYAKFFFK